MCYHKVFLCFILCQSLKLLKSQLWIFGTLAYRSFSFVSLTTMSSFVMDYKTELCQVQDIAQIGVGHTFLNKFFFRGCVIHFNQINDKNNSNKTKTNQTQRLWLPLYKLILIKQGFELISKLTKNIFKSNTV